MSRPLPSVRMRTTTRQIPPAEDEDYNQADSAGFINLFGLSIKERAKLSKSWPKD